MPTIYELKEQAVTETPLLVFDCVLPDGRTERWSTHRVTIDGATYEARVLQHSLFEIQAASDQGVDGIPRISLLLANADSHFSQLERQGGWKGARLTVAFVFYDLRNDAAASERSVVFQGICNPPDEIREATFRITATNRMNLQRMLLPQVRIQRRCPWDFPATWEQRTEAKDGGQRGQYSRYYRCGYSADVAGGLGTLNGDVPFTNCGYTRADCHARGMFAHFGGIGFVPPAISVRSYGDKSYHESAVSVNQARYNDFVPLIYGTGWYTPPVVFARNDGNLTRMEVLLGLGRMHGVIKVLVNDVELPLGVDGASMTGTGWYSVLTLGSRAGVQNPDFTDGSGNPAGDPYGSMAYLAVVAPNRLNDGTSLPRVKVLAQGLELPMFGADGLPTAEQFTNNPAWVLLDLLRRTGWADSEIDFGSFAAAAACCDEEIASLDVYGNAITLPRFGCNLLLQTRRSAGDIVRGVRNAARLLMTYGPNGVLQARVENAIAQERPVKAEWSNSREQLNGGWPSYEFGDGSNGYSGILRRGNNEPSVRLFTRGMADTPNRLTVEFQDGLNEYQQDSFSLIHPDDVARSGQEVSSALSAMGIPNYDQAARLLKLRLDKSVDGNTYVEFETSVKCFGIRPGDLITLTYLKEGFERQPFRVLKLAPGTNHRTTTITSQIHNDAWYDDSNGQLASPGGGRRQGNAGIGLPHPLMGSVLDINGEIQFGVEEATATNGDGTAETNVTVSFVSPAVATASAPPIPLLSLAAQVQAGGSLNAGQTLYYALSASDSAGNESGLSFVVRAVIENGDSSVTLSGLSFGPGTAGFSVYRGTTPARMFRIASECTPAAEFTDAGLPNELAAPPDPNFDHANFYWRMELQPEASATLHSATSVGNDALEMAMNRYRGNIARITRGRGAGQERPVVANSATSLTVAPPWDVQPDASSHFVVAENSWRFGALSRSSPVRFAIPNRGGEMAHLTGRAANVNDVECSPELSIVTRHQIEGGDLSDRAAPAEPFFGINEIPRGGGVELNGVSFTDLANTRTITAGTLTLYYWDELQPRPTLSLALPVDAGGTLLSLNSTGTAVAGDLVLLEAEVMRVEEVLDSGVTYRVTRGMHKSTAIAHGTTPPVHKLSKKTVIVPFPRDFFGSPYSGSWSFPIALPDVRVASAEFFVTNAKGNSPVNSRRFTNNDDCGLRTLSGGQYSIQVAGYLAIDDAAAPAIMVESSHAVRDVYAHVGKAADREVELRLKVNDAPYCTVHFLPGLTVSDAVSGGALPPLGAGDRITLSVVSVGLYSPGADLTLLIRL